MEITNNKNEWQRNLDATFRIGKSWGLGNVTVIKENWYRPAKRKTGFGNVVLYFYCVYIGEVSYYTLRHNPKLEPVAIFTTCKEALEYAENMRG